MTLRDHRDSLVLLHSRYMNHSNLLAMERLSDPLFLQLIRFLPIVRQLPQFDDLLITNERSNVPGIIFGMESGKSPSIT